MKQKQTVSELLESNKQLLSKVHEYENLLNHSPDVIWRMNMRYKLIYVSNSVYTIFGYTVEEWLGKRLSIFERYKEYLKLTKLAIKEIKNYKKKGFVVFESEIKHKNGQTIFIEVATKIVKNKFGIPVGIIGNTRDITKKKKIEFQLIKSEKKLRESNTNKQRLFGIIAHDLVNPFNAILGYTNLLEKDYGSFSEQERIEFIKIINKYATHNYNLTKTLLDWSKVQQDRLVAYKTKLDCKEIVRAAIQPYQVLADKKQIQINAQVPNGIFVDADKNMMQTVIGNLVVNAIKFTPQKGEINLHLDKNKDGTVKIEIEDHGIGMSQEQLNSLFDITKINIVKGTSGEQGNGLGLILCKELMELQNGKLFFTSKLGQGSVATLLV